MKKPNLLSIDTNAKTVKGQMLNYMTAIMYLAPHTQAGLGNVCAYASEGCAAACLFTAGRGRMSSVMNARIEKTKRFFADTKLFIEELSLDIERFIKTANKKGMTPVIRLNGTSDIQFEKLGGNKGESVFSRFPEIQFYDYTKNPNRVKDYVNGKLPSNYHLTFSRSECNHETAKEILAMGGNVAIVFATDDLPKTFEGFKVVNGDETDLRFLDQKNVWVGLKAKGDAKKDTSGFVVTV
jgi:hypothetical protein